MPRPRGGKWRRGTVKDISSGKIQPSVLGIQGPELTRTVIGSGSCLVCSLAPLLLIPTRKAAGRKCLIVPRLHAMLRFGVGLNRGRIVFKSSITQLFGSHHCRAVVSSSSSSVFLDCNSRTSSRFLGEFGARRTWDCEPYRCSKFYQRTLNSTLQISRYECYRDLSWHKMIWELHFYLYIDEELEVVSGVNIFLVRNFQMCVCGCEFPWE